MSDSSNICLSCGLCCDGTLIGFVELSREEIPALKKVMDIKDENGHGFFLQPCSSFCDGCTVYSERPRHCASFKCELLKSVEQKNLEFDLAVETISIVKQKKISIENTLAELKLELKSKSFYFKMVELKNLLQKKKAESSLNQNQFALISDLNQLNELLSSKFGAALF
jgi:Fe-S-cluster containining protein